jgi:drug/metabolite transporter (DMT)-like permease
LLVPVVGVISGWLFLDEALSWIRLIGVFCVLLGISIVNMNAIQRLFLGNRLVVQIKEQIKRAE